MELLHFIKTRYFVMIAIGLVMASCGNDNSVLTKSDVESEIESVYNPMFEFPEIGEIVTGYYELNDVNMRMQLRRMEAAGLITYKAERVIETVEKTRTERVFDGYKEQVSYSYGTIHFYDEPTYVNRAKKYYEEVEHVFVSVALTDEGQKYVVTDSEYEEIQNKIREHSIDKDLICPNVETEYPENSVDDSEIIATIRDDGENGTEETVELQTADEIAAATDSAALAATVDITAEDSDVDETPDGKLSVYSRALKEVSKTTVKVKLYNIDIFKVRKIKCTTEMFEKGEASAEVIYEYVDVTPFGRIIDKKYNGQKYLENYKFTLYADGWAIVTEDEYNSQDATDD